MADEQQGSRRRGTRARTAGSAMTQRAAPQMVQVRAIQTHRQGGQERQAGDTYEIDALNVEAVTGRGYAVRVDQGEQGQQQESQSSARGRRPEGQ
jgi:hypothetical protein